MSAALLVATIALPLAMLAACLSPRLRERVPGWLWLAPLPGLATALFGPADWPLVLDPDDLRFTLALDGDGATLLGVAALLWTAAGVQARAWLRDDPRAVRFAEWWLLTLAGSLWVFVAADLVSFYIAYALVSLPAWGLLVHDDTARVHRAGAVYLGLAVLGEVFLLLAFALMAALTPGESLAIRDVVAGSAGAAGRPFALAFLVAGFGLKIALVPLHVWMPLAYTAAPIPAAAALSGAAVKAGVIGLIRFLPFGVFDPASAVFGSLLAGVGLFSAFYGVAVGITQPNPKTVLAYSSVSQLGLLAALLGMGLATGDSAAVAAANLSASHHLLVKGALFLAIGAVAASGARRAWLVLAPAAVVALSLAGLPFSGGSLAKLASKGPMGEGVAGALATLAAAGTTLLMLHFLRRLAASGGEAPRGGARAGLVAPWLATAAAALAVPWWLGPRLAGVGASDVLAPAALWKAAWPILLGVALAVPLWKFGHRLPSVPEGDLVALGGRAARAAGVAGDGLEWLDRALSRWPVAGLSLAALAILLGAAMLAGS